MKFSLVLTLTLLLLSELTLSFESYSTAQPSNNGAAKGQVDNNARLRALMNELQNTVTTLRKERQAYYSRKQEKDMEVQDLRIQIQSLKETHEELVSEVKDNKNEMVWPVGGIFKFWGLLLACRIV